MTTARERWRVRGAGESLTEQMQRRSVEARWTP
jgi:hypothetical protein